MIATMAILPSEPVVVEVNSDEATTTPPPKRARGSDEGWLDWSFESGLYRPWHYQWWSQKTVFIQFFNFSAMMFARQGLLLRKLRDSPSTMCFEQLVGSTCHVFFFNQEKLYICLIHHTARPNDAQVRPSAPSRSNSTVSIAGILILGCRVMYHIYIYYIIVKYIHIYIYAYTLCSLIPLASKQDVRSHTPVMQLHNPVLRGQMATAKLRGLKY